MTRFRARSSVVYSSIVMGVCAVMAIALLISGSWYEARPAFGILGALTALAFVAYLRPSVDVHEDRVELVNVVTIVTIPYARLKSIGTRWALELRADDASKVTAFAAPAPGALKSRTVTKHQDHFDPDVASLIYEGGPGTSSDTPSGAAAHLVDDAYQAWQESHPADASAALNTPVTTASGTGNGLSPETAKTSGRAIVRRPNWLSIAVLGAALVLLVLTI